MESQKKYCQGRQEEEDNGHSLLLYKDYKRRGLSDILNSSEESALPSPVKNLVSTSPTNALVELNINCSLVSTSDESDKEFDVLLNRLTPFKKGRVQTSFLNSTFNCNDGRNNTRNMLPAKPWTTEKKIRSMRLSSSPKRHITPLIFDSDDLSQKSKPYKNTQSLITTVPNLEAITSPSERGDIHIFNKTKSRNFGSPLQFNLYSKEEKYSFLESLSTKVPLQCAHADALVYRKNFNKHKDELIKVLFELYNMRIFNSKLPENMNITWNPRMTKTAGRCTYKRALKTRIATIELSTKILDCAERVRETLLHELCHAASWIVHGYQDGHGAIWKYWASRANQFFPELPVVSRCHNYDIATKYIYKCTGCGGCIGRHSKSLNIKRKVCGRCGATFQLLTNGISESSVRNIKPLSGFALYVKENYANVKKAYHGINHAEVMKQLSQQFSMMQVTNTIIK